jgi:hypothetical protein
VFKQVITPPGNAGGAGVGGGSNGGDARKGRGPQSSQSVPYWQSGYSAPGPPSSQMPSEPYEGIPMQLLRQIGGTDGGNGRDGGDEGGAGGEGGEGGGDGGGGGGGTSAPKQMRKPPRTTDESVDHSSRVPVGVALRFAIALNAAKPDVVPLQPEPRAHEAQFG